ncbi:hypothetical protein L484_028083 [Morus notabilis]|uniref:Uncharacterized protein n=1 Tax=Morus notabilis TaxID=981085 RepID=W9SIF4_9ROSA|nr:hypothetical protein L484_028083 [Morus notabilis]
MSTFPWGQDSGAPLEGGARLRPFDAYFLEQTSFLVAQVAAPEIATDDAERPSRFLPRSAREDFSLGQGARDPAILLLFEVELESCRLENVMKKYDKKREVKRYPVTSFRVFTLQRKISRKSSGLGALRRSVEEIFWEHKFLRVGGGRDDGGIGSFAVARRKKTSRRKA